MSLCRHEDFSVFPILMQISFGTSQGGISTGHVGQEALSTVLLCLCFLFFLTVYLLNRSGLCWFECLHCLDTLPAAAAAASLWCFRSKLRNLANNLIASHLQELTLKSALLWAREHTDGSALFISRLSHH